MIAGSPAWLQQATARLATLGVDRVGVADGAPWTPQLPGCRSVVVLGSGGRGLWEALVRAVRAQPALAHTPHPLDTLVAQAVASLPQDPSRRWVLCGAEAEPALDFRTLGLQAGLGWPSRLGLLLHPEVGPWLGLRAACFTTEALTVTGPLPGPGPCPSCDAPCEAACPIGAVSAAGLDWRASYAFRQRDSTCHVGCHARSACPEGRAHAYGATQHLYHQHPPSREALLALSAAGPAPDRRS